MVPALRILSRARSGAGATTLVLNAGALREVACETSGAGATIEVCNESARRLAAEFKSGAGATIVVCKPCALRISADVNSGAGATMPASGSAGAVKDERSPSAGGGPTAGLYANRFATEESECGKSSLGESTTLSLGWSPRA